MAAKKSKIRARGAPATLRRVRESEGKAGASFPVPPSRLVLPSGYAETLRGIKRRIGEERLRVVMSANSAMVLLYWDIGRMILERQRTEGWGAKVIDRLGWDLSQSYPDMRGLSASDFARSFKASFGVSCHRWLTDRRVERAKETPCGDRRPARRCLQPVRLRGPGGLHAHLSPPRRAEPGPLAPRAQARISVGIDKSQHESSSPPAGARVPRTDVRIDWDMPRPSNKEKLLADGLRLVHERGFGASSVRDITQAAGVPQGSFTNHFASKEAFGLEILERYRAMTSAAVRATLRNDRLPPLDRLRAWIGGQLWYLRKDDMRRGCLYGNLSAEASEASDAIRFRVASVFAENQASVAYCLKAAIEAGELAPKTDVQELAGFIVSSLQGAILVAKAQRSPIPVERFERVLFRHLLPQDDARKNGVAG